MVASTSGDPDHPPSGRAGPNLTAPDLRLTGVPAVAAALTQARERFETWARAAGMDEARILDASLAAYEAMANVVDHAYEQPGGVFDLHACRRHDLVTVTVTDHGRWKPSSGGKGTWRGRGLLIIERATPEFELNPQARGTTVRMSWPVHARNR